MVGFYLGGWDLVAGDFWWEFFYRLLTGDVVRAGFLANVTAEDAFGFVDLVGDRFWDFVAVFDSVVGDALV